MKIFARNHKIINDLTDYGYHDLKYFDSVVRRLNNSYDDVDDCYLWWRGLDGRGYYGQIVLRPVGNFKRKVFQVHRLIYHLCVGKLKENEILIHTCKKSNCINPLHLKIKST